MTDGILKVTVNLRVIVFAHTDAHQGRVGRDTAGPSLTGSAHLLD